MYLVIVNCCQIVDVLTLPVCSGSQLWVVGGLDKEYKVELSLAVETSPPGAEHQLPAGHLQSGVEQGATAGQS